LGFLKWGKFLDFLSKYCTVCLRMNCFQWESEWVSKSVSQTYVIKQNLLKNSE
jgi:hypothetical protein